MRKILITGAAGFIGFHLSLRLLEGDDRVVGLDNLNPYYDVTLKEARLDILRRKGNFHFVRADLVRVMGRIPSPDPGWRGDRHDPSASFAPYRLYNIGNNRPVALMDFIATLEDCLGRKARKHFLPLQAGDVPATCADVDDLSAAVGFKPATPLAEGVRRFVAWYRDYYGSGPDND